MPYEIRAKTGDFGQMTVLADGAREAHHRARELTASDSLSEISIVAPDGTEIDLETLAGEIAREA